MSDDIAKNIKMIEFYKTELLSSLSFLYGAMLGRIRALKL